MIDSFLRWPFRRREPKPGVKILLPRDFQTEEFQEAKSSPNLQVEVLCAQAMERLEGRP